MLPTYEIKVSSSSVYLRYSKLLKEVRHFPNPASILLRVFHYLFLVLRFKKRGKRIFHSYDEAFGTTDAIKFILFAIKVRYDVFEVSFAPSQTPSLYFWWQWEVRCYEALCLLSWNISLSLLARQNINVKKQWWKVLFRHCSLENEQ